MVLTVCFTQRFRVADELDGGGVVDLGLLARIHQESVGVSHELRA